MEELYTAKEMADMLKFSVDTIWRWGRDGTLETVKFGRQVRFRKPRKGRNGSNKNQTT